MQRLGIVKAKGGKIMTKKKKWRTAVKKPVVIKFREPLAEIEEIKTREGTVKAKRGEDFIIRGVEGELYPIKKKIFYKTYKIMDEG